MTILVIGATGNVGRPTVQALLAKGESVRCLSRSEEKLAALPKGVDGAIGDLENGSGSRFCGSRPTVLNHRQW